MNSGQVSLERKRPIGNYYCGHFNNSSAIIAIFREESVKLFLVAVILKIIHFLYRATFTDWYEWSSSIGVYKGLPGIIIVIGIYWYSVSLAKKGIIKSKHAIKAR